MRDEQGFADWASARAGDLRRQAYLLTGSPERAARLADRALADTGRRWDKLGGAVAAEEHARRVVAAGALRGRGRAPAVALTAQGTAAPTDDSGEAVRRALAGLPPRRRAVLVLRYDEGLDDTAVGARLGFPAATAAAEGEAGLATLRSLLRRRGRPEDLLPAALADAPAPRSAAPAGSDGAAPAAGSTAATPEDGGAVRRPAPGWRRWAVVAVAAVVVAGIVAAVLVPALRDDPADAGPVPAAAGSGPGQLDWPARGPLAGDQDLLRSALRSWQAGVPERQRPVRTAALWAGDLDGVRTTLLQGTDARGQSWIAQVTGSGDTASLRSSEPLGRAVPLLALGTSAGAVRLLAPPDAAPDSLRAAVGTEMRPLAVARDGLTQAVTAPSAGLRVAITDAGAVAGSGTVLPGRLSPVTGPVELTRATLDLGPAQPVDPVWYDDGGLIARRLPAAVGLVQVGPTRVATIRVGARRSRLEVRAYEVVRGGSRYLATVVRGDGAPVCTDTVGVGPADATPAGPVALVARCIPRGSADGVLVAVGTRGIRSVQVTVAPAVPGSPARPGRPARRGRAARTATIAGSSGTGLVGLTAVARMPTVPVPAVVRDGAGRAVARLALPAYRGPRR